MFWWLWGCSLSVDNIPLFYITCRLLCRISCLSSVNLQHSNCVTGFLRLIPDMTNEERWQQWVSVFIKKKKPSTVQILQSSDEWNLFTHRTLLFLFNTYCTVMTQADSMCYMYVTDYKWESSSCLERNSFDHFYFIWMKASKNALCTVSNSSLR